MSILINTEDMHCCFVNESTMRILKPLAINPCVSLGLHEMAVLKRFGLMSQIKNKVEKCALKEPIPIFKMSLFVIQSCNFNCIYCYGKDGSYGETNSIG